MKQEFQDAKQEQLHKLRSDWSALTYSQRDEEFHKLERDLAEDLGFDLCYYH